MMYILILLAFCSMNTMAITVHDKYSSIHKAFGAFLTKSEETLWEQLDSNGHVPGSKYQQLCDEHILKHRSHLDNVFGSEAADAAHTVSLLEKSTGDVHGKSHVDTLFDLHEAVQDSREHYEKHQQNLQELLQTNAVASQRKHIDVTTLVDLSEHGKQLRSTHHGWVSAGWATFKSCVVAAAKLFHKMLKLLADIIRRVVDSAYLGAGALVSTLTGPAPTINLEFSAGDLFVNSKAEVSDPVDNNEPMAPIEPVKLAQKDPIIKASYLWETGQFGPACPVDPCEAKRPVMQFRFVRCIKQLEGQDEAVEAHPCKSIYMLLILFCCCDFFFSCARSTSSIFMLTRYFIFDTQFILLFF